MPTWLTGALTAIAERVSVGMQMLWQWGVSVALALMAWLPNHDPMNLPPPQQFGVLFRGLGVFSRFINIGNMFAIALIIMLFVMWRLFHAVQQKVRKMLHLW